MRIFLCLVCPLFVAGCVINNSPTQSENTYPTGKMSDFASSSGWLIAGYTTYSLSDPSSPAEISSSMNGNLYRDTTFLIGNRYFNIYDGGLYRMTISTTNTSPDWTHLSGYARSAALKDSLLYIVRHKYASQDGYTDSYYQSDDTLNALDVDTLTTDAATALASIPLTDPQATAIVSGELLVLDGTDGLLIFDLTNPSHPKRIATISSIKGSSIKPIDANTFLLWSGQTLSQYSVSGTAVTKISTIQ